MKNIAEFRIIGRVGKVETFEKVAYIDVAANYGRKVNDGWEDDTHWNRVTVFRQNIERASKLGKGDLIHITGRVRQSRFEKNGQTVYGVDLIAESFGTIAKNGKPAEEGGSDD